MSGLLGFGFLGKGGSGTMVVLSSSQETTSNGDESNSGNADGGAVRRHPDPHVVWIGADGADGFHDDGVDDHSGVDGRDGPASGGCQCDNVASGLFGRLPALSG